MEEILDEKTYETRVLHYAPFAWRTAAFLTDIVLSGLVSFALYFVFELAPGYAEFLKKYWWQIAIFYSLYFIYFDGSEHNATPGKQMMNIRMLNEEKRDIDFTTSAKHLVLSILLLPGYFGLLFNEKRQTPADRLCKVVVVKVK